MLLVVAAPIVADTDQQFPGGQMLCKDVARGITAFQSGDVKSRAGLTGVYAEAYMAGMVTGRNMGQINRSILKQPSYRLVDLDSETRNFLVKKYCREHSSHPLTNAVYFSVIGPMVIGQAPRIQEYE